MRPGAKPLGAASPTELEELRRHWRQRRVTEVMHARHHGADHWVRSERKYPLARKDWREAFRRRHQEI